MPANYVLLQRVTLTQATSSVTFSNIPQTGYTDLKVVASMRTNEATVNGGGAMAFANGSNIHSNKRLFGYYNGGSATGSDGSTGSGDITLGNINGANVAADSFSSCEIYSPNYTSDKFKTASIDNLMSGNTLNLLFQQFIAGLWASTSPITQIIFSGYGNWAVGTSFSLYGIAAVGTTPVIAPKANGGDTIVNDGTYWIHTFLSTGVFTPQTGLSCDYLVVAGGGGGGFNGGGGGGAGGFRTGTSLAVTATAYTITVGAGGANTINNATNSVNGNNSTFSTITSTGGGFGSTISGTAGGNGGSGGGGRYNAGAGTGNTPSTSPSQGNNGGAGANYVGGGGGGATAAGNAATVNNGANGGAGTANSYSGSSVTYAGGGGGGGDSDRSAPAGSGGAGGGGNGGTGAGSYGTAGAANTGGGGGGTGSYTTSSGAGGSGIVIIRYPIA
jgi:hypothetical protein